MNRTRKSIEIGSPRGQDAPRTMEPRPTEGKRWYFVTGHSRPVFLTGTERYIRKHPDGTPMLATSKLDSLKAAEARWEVAQVAETQARRRAKKEADDAAG